MKLTDHEKQMLSGKFGRAKQLALQKVVQFAEALGAEELCPVTKATFTVGLKRWFFYSSLKSYPASATKLYLGEELPLSFDEDCLGMNDCDASLDQDPAEINQSRAFYDRSHAFYDDASALGVAQASTCTPYQAGWIPLMGEHIVTTESSNVLFCNSVWGAMVNCGGSESTFWSAVCGRTPLWGNHIKENRYGTHIFHIKCKTDTIHDWDLLGHALGRMMPTNARPVLVGDFERPCMEKLKQCFAAMATTSSAEICHIVGVTPEAQTLQMALQGHEPLEEFYVTDREIARSQDFLCAPGEGPVDYVSLGCPHMSIEELRTAARYLEGKKVKEGVKLHLWTASPVEQIARDSGFVRIIEEAGGKVLTGGCPMNTCNGCMDPPSEHRSCTVLEGIVGAAFDSAKQAHYLKSSTKAPLYYGDLFKCLDTAVSGYWTTDKGPEQTAFQGRGIIPGVVTGEALVCPDSIQGYLGLAANGVIIEKGHPEEGKSIDDKILVMPSSKGSIAWAFSFKQAYIEGHRPLGWMFTKIDSKCATAAVSLGVSAVCDFVDGDPVEHIKTGDLIRLDGQTGEVCILKRASE